jgi:peptidyl-dipeptidase Dcp
MRELISRSFMLLFVTVMIVSVIVNIMANNTVINARANVAADPNPLLADWEGPYGGVPPFDKVQVALFKPALESAMTQNLMEVEAIAKDPAAPTFENTLVAFERAGSTLDRVSTLYGVWGSTMAGPEFQVVQREMAPKLAAFNDKITQNEALFKRIEAVYNSPDKKKLTPEQQRLSWLYYTNFVRAGARLNPEAKARLSQINQKLAGLYTRFSQNVLAEEDGQFVLLKDEADLAGLPQSLKDAAAAAAIAKKQTGAGVISNTRSSVDPFLTYSDRRDLREKVWRMFINRGDNGDEHDNNAIITEMSAIAATVSITVEEQNAAVSSIAEGVNRASLEAQSGAQAMSRVAGASTDARVTAGDVKSLADTLSAEAESLDAEVQRFLAGVQAA